MANVHPSSFVDPQAVLADDVQVGPWCIIQGDVRIGPGCVIMERVTLKGPLTLGASNVIYPNCCIGLEPQDRKFDPDTPGAGTRIGDHNILREGVTIHRATQGVPTTLGDHNMIMANGHLAHDCIVGNQNTLANSCLLAGHTILGDQIIMSGHTGSHQFCRIGRMAMVSGNLATFEDIPPFCVMAAQRSITGLNLVGLRRAGCRASIGPLKQAYDIFFLQRHTKPVALRMLDQTLAHDPLCMEFANFIREPSRRGITKALTGRDRTLAEESAGATE